MPSSQAGERACPMPDPMPAGGKRGKCLRDTETQQLDMRLEKYVT